MVNMLAVHFWAAKNEPKSCPLQAAYSLRCVLEAGRKVFSLSPLFHNTTTAQLGQRVVFAHKPLRNSSYSAVQK